MIDKNSILKHSPHLGDRSMLSDGLVIHQFDKLHTLNETAMEIFEMFDGTRSYGDVIDEFAARYPDTDDVNEIVELFITRLYDAGLLVE